MATVVISIELYRVFRLITARPKQWFTCAEVARGARVAPRTARHHLVRMTKLRLLDVAEVFPARKYKLSPLAKERNKAMWERLTRAAEVFQEPAKKARRK